MKILILGAAEQLGKVLTQKLLQQNEHHFYALGFEYSTYFNIYFKKAAGNTSKATSSSDFD